MADDDQAIKIVVEVVDKFSKPLRDLKATLEAMGGGGEKVGRVTTHFEGLRKSIEGTAGSIKGLLVPSLNAIGISVLGIGAAFGTMTAGLREFAKTTKEMVFLSRETGITLDKLHEFEAVGKAAGITSGQFASSFNVFARNMQAWRAGVGAIPEGLKDADAGVRAFILSLRGVADNAEVFQRIIKFSQNMPRQIDRQRLFELFGLPGQFARLNREQLQEVLDDHEKYHIKLTAGGLKSVNEFNRSLRNLGFTWDSFFSDLANKGALEPFTKMVDAWREAISKPEFKDALANLAEKLTNIAQNLPGLVNAFARLVGLANQWSGIKDKPGEKPDTEGGADKSKGLIGGSLERNLNQLDFLPAIAAWLNRMLGLGGPGSPGGAPGATPPAQKQSFEESNKKSTYEGTLAALRAWGTEQGNINLPPGATPISYSPPGGSGGNPLLRGRGFRGAAGGGGGGGGGGEGDGIGGDGGGIRGALPRVASLPPDAGGGVPQEPSSSTGAAPMGRETARSILSQARAAALSGGPAGVFAFMKQHGHPRSGAWCGQFAAAVVEAAGGVPPRHPEVASNWRNYGHQVDTPQPGDIAVRRGTRTGSTSPHGHVTVVDEYDPKTGKFYGIGGNQGRSMRSQYSKYGRRGYDFYRAGDDGYGGITADEAQRSRVDAAAAPTSKIEGAAHLKIDLNGFPSGTRTGYATSGDLFSGVEVNRGNAAPQVTE